MKDRNLVLEQISLTMAALLVGAITAQSAVTTTLTPIGGTYWLSQASPYNAYESSISETRHFSVGAKGLQSDSVAVKTYGSDYTKRYKCTCDTTTEVWNPSTGTYTGKIVHKFTPDYTGGPNPFTVNYTPGGPANTAWEIGTDAWPIGSYPDIIQFMESTSINFNLTLLAGDYKFYCVTIWGVSDSGMQMVLATVNVKGNTTTLVSIGDNIHGMWSIGTITAGPVSTVTN